ncbi:ArnT family glycosyltransferase [Eisenbergiella sp.]
MYNIEDRILEKRKIIYLFLFTLAVFMHLFKLADVPYGLHIDEAGMAYDAYCLANYSVDRYLNHYPVYLINFGGGQSAMMAYLVAGLIKLTGSVSHWIIRLPGAIIGILSYIAGVKIVRKCMGEKWGLVSGFFLAIFPYFIMQSRFGLDCNLLLGVSTIALYFILVAKEKNKTFFFVWAGILWGICYYTYALSYISNTVFLVLLLCYWLYTKKITLKHAICFCLPLVFLVLPLLLTVIINTFDLPQINTPFFTIPRIPGYRGGDIIFTKMWSNLVTTIKDILTKDWLPYNAFDKYYTMYRISIVFAVVGGITLFADMLKKLIRKEYSEHMPFLLLLLTQLMLGTLIGDNGPNINRMNGIFFALFYCVLYGMRYSYVILQRVIKNYDKGKDTLLGAISSIPYVEKKIVLLILIVYCFNFVTFARYYFWEYAYDVNPQLFFADTYEDITDYIETSTGEPKVVYTNTSYIYYYLTEKLDPYEANILENGTGTYWKYAFWCPQDVEKSAIYVLIDEENEFTNKLEVANFEKFKSGMFVCYYKK